MKVKAKVHDNDPARGHVTRGLGRQLRLDPMTEKARRKKDRKLHRLSMGLRRGKARKCFAASVSAASRVLHGDEVGDDGFRKRRREKGEGEE